MHVFRINIGKSLGDDKCFVIRLYGTYCYVVHSFVNVILNLGYYSFIHNINMFSFVEQKYTITVLKRDFLKKRF